jgi:hypothetical protein
MKLQTKHGHIVTSKNHNYNMSHQPIRQAHLLLSICRSSVSPIQRARRWWHGGLGAGPRRRRLQLVENDKADVVNHGGGVWLYICYKHGVHNGVRLLVGGASQIHRAPSVVMRWGHRRLQSKVTSFRTQWRRSLLGVRGLAGVRSLGSGRGGIGRRQPDSEDGALGSNQLSVARTFGKIWQFSKIF